MKIANNRRDTLTGFSQDFVWDRPDVDTKRKNQIDLNYLVINYIDVGMDNKYPLIDIYYLNSTLLV